MTGGRHARAGAVLFAVIATVCITCGAAKEDPELKVLSQALAAKKAAIHALTTNLHTKKIRPAPAAAAAAAAHTSAIVHESPKATHTSKKPSPLVQQKQHGAAAAAAHVPLKHPSPLMALKTAPEPKPVGEGDLLSDNIDDKMVGDFSKDKNKNDHRMMNGKFDWLLKASSPLYTAAKTVAGAAQHQLHKALSKDRALQGGSSLQEEGNATSTEADKELDDAKKSTAAEASKALEFSKDKETYFFITWIVVLVVVLGILGLCLLYARKCLGAPESHEAPPPGTKGSARGYGTVK